MYSPSLEFLKSPIENVVNLLGGVPQDHEKALKHAFYNALAMFLLMLALAAAWAVYIVLEPFFKPLLWALLCGSVLYPIKHSLANSLQRWLNSLSESSTPLFLGVLIIPLKILDDASQRIGDLTMKYIVYLGALVLSTVMFHIIYQYTPQTCIYIIWQIATYGNVLILWFMKLFGGYMILTAVIGYTVLLICFWTPNASHNFVLAASVMWFMISLFLASLASSFQVTVFFGLQFLLALGYGYEVWLLHKRITASGKKNTLFETVCAVMQGIHEEDIIKKQAVSAEDEKKDLDKVNYIMKPSSNMKDVKGMSDDLTEEARSDQIEKPIEPSTLKPSGDEKHSDVKDGDEFIVHQESRKRPSHLHQKPSSSTGSYYPRRTTSLPDTTFQKQMIAAIHRRKSRGHTGQEQKHEERSESTRYLYGLVSACIILSMWTYTWLLHSAFLLFLIYIVKNTGQYFQIWRLIHEQYQCLQEAFQRWYGSRQKVIFPLPLSGLYKLMLQLNYMALEMLKGSVNMACCTVVILGVNIAIISTIVFFTVQVYSEGIHILHLSSNILNSTYIKNTTIMEYFLASGWKTQIDSVLNDAYAYGRQGISTGVHHWLKGVDPEKAAQLEKQVVELWDRVYQAWMTSGTAEVGPKVTSSAIYASWDSILEGVQKTPELFNTAGIMAFLQENVGTLLTVFDSVWTILKGNLTLCVDSFTAVVMILFGSGSAVINFFVNLIVFFTALFYLLASSQDMYKPVDLITKYSPNSGNRFAVALEDATASVFHASLKRAIISGLCTWLIHSIFQVKLIYIPSVLAALLGAIPFMGAYWASFPAVLELYIQDYAFFAVLLAVIQILSVQAVDTAVYKEIKGGGHPYLTGLSIAGGMFWLGPEGVIMGPLLLCALFVAINMSTSILQESEPDPQLQEHVKHLSELSQLNEIRRTAL